MLLAEAQAAESTEVPLLKPQEAQNCSVGCIIRRCSCLLVKHQLLLSGIVLLPDKRSEGPRLPRRLVVWQCKQALAAGARCCAQAQCCKKHGIQQVVGARRGLQNKPEVSVRAVQRAWI